MLHLVGRRLMTASTLGGLVGRLPGSFLRVAKSYVVNLVHVVAYDLHTVQLEGDERARSIASGLQPRSVPRRLNGPRPQRAW